MTGFALMAKPGAGCNLDCAYCFWPRPGHELMSVDTMRLMARQYEEASAFQAYIWQGEPTEQPLSFYEEFRRVAHPDAQVAFQTNGVKLDGTWLDFLSDAGWFVGLSVDGPTGGPRQVERRVLEDRMAALREREIIFNVLCLVNRANDEHGAETAAYLAQHATHVQFIAALPRWPGDTEHAITGQEMAAFLRAAREARAPIVIENYRQAAQASTCEYGMGCGTYLTVLHDGSVYPCDFYQEPRWKLGTLQDDGLAAIWRHKRALKEFRKLPAIPAEGCEDCALLERCGRGCPRSRYVAEGDQATKDPLCEMRKEVMSPSARP